MHREVHTQAALTPPQTGFPGDDPHLMVRLQLPPSIPVSKDGEEGAYAYHLGLLQSNAESRPERYHAPPNRTLDPRGQHDDLGFHSHYATSTTTKTLGSSNPGIGTGDSKTPLQTTDSSCSTGHSAHLGGTGKTVPRADKLPKTLWGAHEVGEKSLTLEAAVKPPAAAAAAVPKQRSSSAEGFRRIIGKYSFLRNFSRKHTSSKTSALHPPPQLPPPLPPTEAELRELAGVAGVLSEAGSPSGAVKQVPWELPPNYVDMIFIKDSVPSAAGLEKQSDVARKQQQQHKQQKHCLRQHLIEQQQQQPNKSTKTEILQTTKTSTKQT